MRILLVHNYYKLAGGEEIVVHEEGKILRNAGHDVSLFEVSNDRIDGLASQLRVGLNAIYSLSWRRKLREILIRKKPHVVHVHNFFPLLSPSIYDACADVGIPVVQILHNYRLLCPAAQFIRKGRVCEECLARGPFRGVRYGCYRNSRLQTLPGALMVAIHKKRRTWYERVNRLIALTEFAREMFIRAGFPPHKLVVKPNFITTPVTPRKKLGDYAVFVGRLSAEKGVETLFRAWRELKGMPLKVIGNGPLLDRARRISPESVEVLGRKTHEEALSLMSNALFLVLPSEWYEGFPMVIAEAMACGVPVLASRLGAMAEIIDDSRTGLLFEPGNARELAG